MMIIDRDGNGWIDLSEMVNFFYANKFEIEAFHVAMIFGKINTNNSSVLGPSVDEIMREEKISNQTFQSLFMKYNLLVQTIYDIF